MFVIIPVTVNYQEKNKVGETIEELNKDLGDLKTDYSNLENEKVGLHSRTDFTKVILWPRQCFFNFLLEYFGTFKDDAGGGKKDCGK